MPDRPVVRVLWHSTDGRLWRPVNVYAGSPLSGGVSHTEDGFWTDGYGNRYRNTPPKEKADA